MLNILFRLSIFSSTITAYEKFIFAKRADIENPFFKIEDYPDPYEPDKRNKEVYEYCHIRKQI